MKKNGNGNGKINETHIVVPAICLRTVKIRVVGDSALICHRWSEKARKEMLDKQMHVPAQARGAKNPEKLYKESLYKHPSGGYGFPAVAFKSAAVDAANTLDLKKTEMRQAFHVNGDLVKINGKPSMREDMVRIGMGKPDIRYRAEFIKWSTELSITFNEKVISASQIATLLNAGGFGVGVGEWRPQRDGSFGRFHVE